MAKFIEVTDIAGTKRLINLAWVEEIWNGEEGVDIYFAFSCPNAVDQDYLRVQESYDEIKVRAMSDGEPVKIQTGEKTYTIEEIARAICADFEYCAEECPGFTFCGPHKNGVLAWLKEVLK